MFTDRHPTPTATAHRLSSAASDLAAVAPEVAKEGAREVPQEVSQQLGGTNQPTVVLAAGGTGGHLFPAFALAQELSRRGFNIDLMTDMRGDRYGTGFPARTIHKVPSATMQGRSPVALAKTSLTLARGVAAARSILAKVQPAVVVGFGGYPSFPPLMAAKLRGIPTLLHEQNAVLGRANRLLAARVDAV
ncbi:MAG: glycosyltransferase, partial [Pseudomonadota bacterium]